MRAFSLAVILCGGALLSGCEQIAQWRNPAIKACRAQLLDKLRSPASYKEISVETHSSAISKAEYSRLNSSLYTSDASDWMLPKSPAIYSVIITYDAANAFGASLRNKELCQFVANRADEPPDKLRAEGAVDMVRNHIDPATGEPEPCCLTAWQKRDREGRLLPLGSP